jgi:hypothetical protein
MDLNHQARLEAHLALAARRRAAARVSVAPETVRIKPHMAFSHHN